MTWNFSQSLDLPRSGSTGMVATGHDYSQLPALRTYQIAVAPGITITITAPHQSLRRIFDLTRLDHKPSMNS